MAATIITPEDLKAFKLDLLEAIQKLFNQKYPSPIRRWLKSHEVRRILTISPAKLQKLRDEGTLPFTKIGAVIFYDYDDIEKMLIHYKQKAQPKHISSSASQTVRA